ncbi:hypothetical protein DFS34DRAFT_648174 [Phlyctochytrium arcticum]|nr:hypothetical protein DFS34DRAFT_648174 [Phlyctochytrium arcticum]
MGQAPSGMEPMTTFCQVEALASQKCMQQHNYDREAMRLPCRQSFQDYRDCKQRWLEMKGQFIRDARKATATADKPVS